MILSPKNVAPSVLSSQRFLQNFKILDIESFVRTGTVFKETTKHVFSIDFSLKEKD